MGSGGTQWGGKTINKGEISSTQQGWKEEREEGGKGIFHVT